mmetsp:Transcript_27398/g.41478  ORF Transcript_27398/g.41478 Transcript_27398/m.41478 type:complete len:541 (+) Transcript_27398:69-1691(+)
MMKHHTSHGKGRTKDVTNFIQATKKRKLLNDHVNSSPNGSEVNESAKEDSLKDDHHELLEKSSKKSLEKGEPMESMPERECQHTSTKANILPLTKPEYQIPLQEVNPFSRMPPPEQIDKALRQTSDITWAGQSTDSTQSPLRMDVLTRTTTDEPRQPLLSHQHSWGSLDSRTDIGNMGMLIRAASATSSNTSRVLSRGSSLSISMDGCSPDNMAHAGGSFPTDSTFHFLKNKTSNSQSLENLRSRLPGVVSKQPSSNVSFMDDTKPEVENTIVQLYQKRVEEVPDSPKDEKCIEDNQKGGNCNDEEKLCKSQINQSFCYSNEHLPPLVGNQQNGNAARLQESKSMIQHSILKLYEERSEKPTSSIEKKGTSITEHDCSNESKALSSVISGVMEIFEQHKKKAEVEASQKKKSKPRKIRGALANLPKQNKRFVDKPTEFDVLFGRGTGPRQHPGNKDYYRRVGSMRDAYRAKSTNSEEKTRIANEILSWIRERGRFLAKEEDGSDRWVEVDEAKAREKIRQALREHKYEWERNTTDRKVKP